MGYLPISERGPGRPFSVDCGRVWGRLDFLKVECSRSWRALVKIRGQNCVAVLDTIGDHVHCRVVIADAIDARRDTDPDLCAETVHFLNSDLSLPVGEIVRRVLEEASAELARRHRAAYARSTVNVRPAWHLDTGRSMRGAELDDDRITIEIPEERAKEIVRDEVARITADAFAGVEPPRALTECDLGRTFGFGHASRMGAARFARYLRNPELDEGAAGDLLALADADDERRALGRDLEIANTNGSLDRAFEEAFGPWVDLGGEG